MATMIVKYAYDTDLSAWDSDVARDMLEHGCQEFKNFMAMAKVFGYGELQAVQEEVKRQ